MADGPGFHTASHAQSRVVIVHQDVHPGPIIDAALS